jgi:hypothetical protein
MLAAALNYIGFTGGQKLGHLFAKSLEGFTVIELITDNVFKEDRLQLCQPDNYQELQKYLQKQQDQDGAYLIIRGPKDKILRSIRQMFFFDKEKKYDRVLLERSDGITDFPWALQIVIVQPPIPAWKQTPECILNADIIVFNDSDELLAGEFASRTKTVRPDTPFFMVKMQEDLSQELKDILKDIFTNYLEKRRTIKDVLELQHPERQITCVQARNLAGKLSVSSFLVGSVCDELGYSVTRCGLGCF